MQFKWKRIWLTIYVLKDMRSAAEPEYELFWATVAPAATTFSEQARAILSNC
jgi:hypothetical protein